MPDGMHAPMVQQAQFQTDSRFTSCPCTYRYRVPAYFVCLVVTFDLTLFVSSNCELSNLKRKKVVRLDDLLHFGCEGLSTQIIDSFMANGQYAKQKFKVSLNFQRPPVFNISISAWSIKPLPMLAVKESYSSIEKLVLHII